MTKTARTTTFAEMLHSHGVSTFDDGPRVKHIDSGGFGVVWAHSLGMLAVDMDAGNTVWASQDKFEKVEHDGN